MKKINMTKYHIYSKQLELLTIIEAQKLVIFSNGAIQFAHGNNVIASVPNDLVVSAVPLSKPTSVEVEKSPEEVEALNILKEKAKEGSYAPISELADKGYQGEVKAEPYIYHNLQLVDREKDIVKDFVADEIYGNKHSEHYYKHGKLIHMSEPNEEINIISTHIKFSQPTTVNLKGHMSLYIVDLIEVTEDMVLLYFDAKKVTAVKRSDFKLLSPNINFKF